MTAKLKTDSGWKNISSLKLKTAEGWKNISNAYIKTATGWKIFFGSGTPGPENNLGISSNTTLFPSTLTGTNYHWNVGDTFTFIFQKAATNSGDNADWTNIGTYATITNPSSGSSTSKTYVLSQSDFIDNQSSTWFRFVVKAVNTSLSQTYYSYSNGIQIYTPPLNTVIPAVTPTSGAPGVATFSTTTGTWKYAPILYTYKWKYSDQGSTWVSISGATNSTYSPPSNFVSLYGNSLACFVKANNGNDSIEVSSNYVTVAANRTVYWNANGGTVTPTSSSVAYPYSVINPTPTRTSYTFSGWFDSASGDYIYGGPTNGAAGASFTIPYDGITMYARWIVNSYTIYYYGNGSTGGATASGSYNIAGPAHTISSNGFTKTNYSFTGWNTAANGSGTSYAVGDSYSTESDLILYAQWSKNQYTVTYDEQGGSAVTDATVDAGTATILPTTTRQGYTFNGWYDTSSGDYTYGGPTNGAAGQSFTPLSNITMYARWIVKTAGAASITTSNITSSGFTASWSATNAETYYVDIYRASNGISITGYPKTDTTLTTSGAITGLSSKVAYTIQVSGKNILGTTGTQAIINVTTL